MNTGPHLPHDWFPHPLPANVALGHESWCYSSFSFLHFQSVRPRAVVVGDHSGIYYTSFFDLGPDGEVEIGDYCTLVGVIISTNSRVEIGDYAFLAHQVVLADSAAARPWKSGDRQPGSSPAQSVAGADSSAPRCAIVVGTNTWIGARAVLLSGARIGDGAIVGAASLVDFEVPPYAIVGGNPARIVGWAKESSTVDR